MGAQADRKGRRVRGRSAEMLSGLGVVLLLLGGFGAAQGKVTPFLFQTGGGTGAVLGKSSQNSGRNAD